MPIPAYKELMLPLLQHANDNEEVRLREAVGWVSDEFNLSEEERKKMLPSGRDTLIRNRTSWAVTYMVKALLLDRTGRGIFTITNQGREALAQIQERRAQDPELSNGELLNRQFLMQYAEFAAFQGIDNEQGADEADEGQELDSGTPQERIEKAHKEIVRDLADELLKKILVDASPEFFEKLVIQLLVSMGYGGSVDQAGQHLGRTGDGGVDGVIVEDVLGLGAIYIQAKRNDPSNTVGRPQIQQFVGALTGKGASKGVFVTTSSFSKEAEEYAKNVSQQKVVTIDGKKLTSLMFEHNVGVRIDQTFDLKKIDENFFQEDD